MRNIAVILGRKVKVKGMFVYLHDHYDAYFKLVLLELIVE